MNAILGAWIDGFNIKVADVRITDGLHTSPTDPFHTILDKRGLFVIHAVLLHTGKVLWFCGHVEDGHYALKSYLFDYRNPGAQLASQDFVLHNPSLARGAHLPNDPNTGDFHADLFCSHFVHTHDGKVLVVGGSDPDYSVPGGGGHGSVGETYIHLFDPVTETWSSAMNGATPSRLRQGRWYPTAVMLGDGRVAVFSGRREFAAGPANATPAAIKAGTADEVEILTPPDYDSTLLTGANIRLPIYPGLHLAPDGRIYYTHTTWGLEFDPPTETVSIEIPNGADTASWTTHADVRPPPATAADIPRREEGMSVLLPPAQDGRILLIGGGEALGAGGRVRNGNAFTHIRDPADARSTAILDTSGADPVWTAGPTLAHPRINVHAVILPDRKVLICGGHNSHKWNAVFPGSPPDPAVADNAQSLICELYDPATDTLAPAAALNHARMYHAAAVLLPDGTVLIAGGADADPGKTKVRLSQNEFTIHNPAPDSFSYPGFAPNPAGAPPDQWAGPRIFAERPPPNSGTFNSIPYNRKDYEIYSPPYLFPPGTQPSIDAITRDGAATTRADYGDTLRIRSSEAAAGTEAALIRPGAATHHTDSEQRYVALTVSEASGNELSVTIPDDRNLVPPGYYMLWIVKAGKPCVEAKFILVGSYLEPEPPPDEDEWCIVVTAAMGSVDALEVVFLQDLRRELIRSGETGRRFIRSVNAIYYSASPRIARAMRRHAGLNKAVRDVVVLPAVSLIAQARRASGFAGGPRRGARLIAMLAAMGLAGLALLPVLALLVVARWTHGALCPESESGDE